MSSSISRFILPSILVVGATGFGVVGMPIQMGLFIVACGLAIVFLNIDKFESFKGAGFEATVVKGTEAAVLEQHQKILVEALKSQLSNVQGEQSVAALAKDRAPTLDIGALTGRRLLELSDAGYISVDLSKFGNGKGEWKFLPDDIQTVPELLDQVFLLLPSASPFSYGKQWVLVDRVTSTPFTGLDKLGPVRLAQAGIKAGSKLAVAMA